MERIKREKGFTIAELMGIKVLERGELTTGLLSFIISKVGEICEEWKG